MNEFTNNTKVAIVEIGGSHDECILTQVIALKKKGCKVSFCGTKEIYERNALFSDYFDDFYEVRFPKTMLGDFNEMRRLNKWFSSNGIQKVIANTAQGGHIRNLTLTAKKNIEFFGIIHTIKLFQGSFTQNLISKKIKNYFVLSDELLKKVNYSRASVRSFYPIDYPSFDKKIEKPTDEIWVGIIGGVEFRRKDLTGFIEFAKSVNKLVKFIFLGKSDEQHPDVQSFIAMIKDARLEDKITWFDYFVNQETFDAYCKSFDIIMPLIHPETPSAEEYLTRQIPGSLNVAFGYKIPLFVHKNYDTWKDFDKGVVFYELDTIQSAFEVLVKSLSQLKMELKNVEKWNVEYQQIKFVETILKKI